jgi:hypothetical protein
MGGPNGSWFLGTLTCAKVTVGIVLQAKECSDGIDNVSEGFKAVGNLRSLEEELIDCVSERLCDSDKEQALQGASMRLIKRSKIP